jgi:hypothetical protein
MHSAAPMRLPLEPARGVFEQSLVVSGHVSIFEREPSVILEYFGPKAGGLRGVTLGGCDAALRKGATAPINTPFQVPAFCYVVAPRAVEPA